MGYPLVPHLHHVGSGAWFEPLSLTAAMPARIAESVSDEEKLAHIHEYVHYLQATTTFFGVSRFHTLWWSASDMAALLSKPAFEPAEKQAFIQRHQERLESLAYLAVPSIWETDTVLEEGAHYVDTGERHVAVYVKPGPAEGITQLFPLGAEALQESMAMAVECWYGYSSHTYQLAKAANNQAFHYAAGTEALRSLTGWDDDTLWWLTVMLGDIALDHLMPYYAFYYGAMHLKESYPAAPPALDELPDLYRKVQAAVRIEEVEQERAGLYREIEGIIQRSEASDDVFDRAFIRLLRNISTALQLRQQRPSLFVEHVLGLDDTLDLLDQFHLPCYRVDNQLVTTSMDENLVNAILFLMALMHNLNCFVDEQADRQCPFFHNHDQCGFSRVPACSSAPWNREAENGEGCLSRFVAHGLQHAAR